MGGLVLENDTVGNQSSKMQQSKYFAKKKKKLVSGASGKIEHNKVPKEIKTGVSINGETMKQKRMRRQIEEAFH